MLLEDIVNYGRIKGDRIVKRSKLKAKRMNPNEPSDGDEETPEQKQQRVVKSSYGTRPVSPSDGMGGEDKGTGLFS